MLGSVIPASQGNLVILVSGEVGPSRGPNRICGAWRNIFFLGEKGLANRMKLVNNLVLGTFMAVIAEATVLGERSGIRRKQSSISCPPGGNSGVMNAKKERILNEDFTTHSPALIYKDLHYLQDLARTLRVPLFTGAATKEIFALTFRENKDPLDMSVVYEVIKAGHG